MARYASFILQDTAALPAVLAALPMPELARGRGLAHDGCISPGRQSHFDTTLYISLLILHTKYTGWRETDLNDHA
jgi:hypothetical protein